MIVFSKEMRSYSENNSSYSYNILIDNCRTESDSPSIRRIYGDVTAPGPGHVTIYIF